MKLPINQIPTKYGSKYARKKKLGQTNNDVVIQQSIANTSLSKNEFNLNVESKLKHFGYQITGLTKEARWIALEKAVSELGVQYVIERISFNIRIRKNQKQGTNKFSYAIREWEHDIKRLKVSVK